jgi:competence protein ComEA
MKLSEFVADYLTFTRRDRIAILVILFLILVVVFLPSILPKRTKTTPTDTAWSTALKKLEQTDSSGDETRSRQYASDNSNNYQYDRSATSYLSKTRGELFYFDPNTLSAEGWAKLGIREKTIHTIQNYLSKGGHFKNPEGLQKIYGLFPDEYERIAPYIKIDPGTEVTATKSIPEGHGYPPAINAPRYAAVDVNTTDTNLLIALPGIGSKLAGRIITFRDKLGGFYSIDQIGETYGLPDSTFQKIKQYLKLNNTIIRKININTATIDELKVHPYIRWNIANPLIAYRNEHGPFAKLEDLKKVMVVTEDVYNKIAPYLSIQ